MSFVLDTSITMKWCFEDEAGPNSEAILERLRENEEAYVPSLWLREVANVILMAERRGRLAQTASSRFIQILMELPIRIVHGTQVSEIALLVALARDHSLSAYDASYLQLALTTGLPLATVDERLRIAANKVGVALIG